MSRVAIAFTFALIVLQALYAQEPAQRTEAPAPVRRADTAAKLPVRRVILYKNGVGYFEHVGKIRGSQAVAIDFNSTQLNDVLKSLTTLDLGDGRITNISYNSEAPFAQRLGALRLPVGEQTTLAQFLGALRGARLEVRTGTQSIAGRLLSVERRTRGRGEDASSRDELTLVTDGGDVRTIEMTPAVSVRLAERDSADQVGRYLSLLASTRAQDQRRMLISTSGTGERDLLVSYVSEVPIWKTTYRVVLPSKAGGKPLLQGWAIVDNTIGEDWSNVELSLVAGAPQSFIQQISQPFYARRPVVPLPSTVLLAPQTHEATLTGGSEQKLVDFIAPVAEQVTVTGARGRVAGGLARAPAPPASPAPAFRDEIGREAVEERMRQGQASATGQELGDLFEYKVGEPITILKNQSALVPIVVSEITAERISLWNDRAGGNRPLRGLWVTNSTPLTLDGGSFTVLENAAFAGEGIVEPLKPGEKRLISYAVDLGVQVDAKRGEDRRRLTRLRIEHGVVVQQSEERSVRTYTVRNNDTAARTVIIEHPVRAGWSLSGDMQPAETSASAYRFRLPVDTKKEAALTITEVHPLETRIAISQISDDQIAVFLRDTGENRMLVQALTPIVAKKSAIAALAADIATRQAEVNRIGEDQSRVRENMKSLKGTSEEQQLVKRYAAQLNQQEDRLEALRKESADLEQKRQQAQAELTRMLEALSFDIDVAKPQGAP